jgi:uncharacterized protein (DUF1697 family)
MQTYITFLRGINITGHNLIKMTDIAVIYKNLGFKDVETYIQSGNVIFSSAAGLNVQDISLKIEEAIHIGFSYDVPVLIRTIEEIRKLIIVNPFLTENLFEPSKMAVIFLNKKLSGTQIQKVKNIDYPPEKFKISGSEIFIYCPNGFGKAKLSTNFFEKKMGIIGTARNWNTINTILNIVEKRN